MQLLFVEVHSLAFFMSATLAFTGACSADLESFLPNRAADLIGRGQKKKVSDKCLEHKLCHHKLLPFSLLKYFLAALAALYLPS